MQLDVFIQAHTAANFASFPLPVCQSQFFVIAIPWRLWEQLY